MIRVHTIFWTSNLEQYSCIKKIDTFKIEIRKWKQTNYPCRLCKTYAKDLGFINISQNVC